VTWRGRNRRGVGFMLLMAGLALPCGARAAEEVKVVVVANFEIGADTGDEPGEFQDWVEREHLDQKLDVRGAPDVVRRNASGLYGIILRHGVTDLAAFVLDPRFDFHRTYWLFTGISGVDPRVASVGSVAWARWVIDGDMLREIDDREIPKDWPYGLYAIGAAAPDALPGLAQHFGSGQADVLNRAYPLNQGLARWAFEVSKTAPLDDNPVVAKARMSWKGFPQAMRPPFLLMGETLGTERFGHGRLRTRWAEDWVRLWTHGQGVFVMTNEESQVYQREMIVLAHEGFVDADRILVLRSASNFSMPPPGVAPTATIADAPLTRRVAFDNNERAGAPVVRELLAHWAEYRDRIPHSPP
jgi:purine nucleoside permease